MMSRVRKQMAKKDEGFTLIELLVVMIIIGILAAIAIPIFLSQRAKAEDSAAKADVSTIGKEMATYYVDGTGTQPSVVISTTTGATLGHYLLGGDDIGKASTNVKLGTMGSGDSTSWCVSVYNPKGDKAVAGVKYSATGGMEVGSQCS